MSAYTETRAVADAGLAAGQSLWAALEAAYAASSDFMHSRLVLTFECVLQSITEEMADEGALFGAAARKAIPDAMLSKFQRDNIGSAECDAWGAYYNARMDDRAEQAADFAHDARREVA